MIHFGTLAISVDPSTESRDYPRDLRRTELRRQDGASQCTERFRRGNKVGDRLRMRVTDDKPRWSNRRQPTQEFSP